MFTSRALALGALTLALGLSPVFAEQIDPRDTAITARQALMNLYSFNLAPLVEMDKGTIPYDGVVATAAAANIMALSMLDQTSIWIEGSDHGYLESSNTLPTIWAEDSYLSGKVKGMVNTSVQLHDTVGNGIDALQTAVVKLNKSCNACHVYTIENTN